jgi:hypothetical protein
MRTREEGAGKQRAGEEELREQIVESREQRAANKSDLGAIQRIAKEVCRVFCKVE